MGPGAGALRGDTRVGTFQQAGYGRQGQISRCKAGWDWTGICGGHLTLQLSVARWLGVRGSNDQPCVVGGVVVCVYIVVVQ